MLDQFQNFDTNRMSLEQLVELSAFGTALRNEYALLQLDEPDFVDVQLKALKREIRTRAAGRIEKELREAKARLETLKTPNQKKTELQARIKELQGQLADVG